MTAGADIAAAVAHVRSRSPLVPRVAIVLGSGLGAFARALERSVRVPYDALPSFPPTTVAGHAGELVLGTLAGIPAVVLSGRLHLYEGYSAEEIARPIRVAAGLGATVAVLTNAAGAINASYKPGELMLITDHINLSGANPLTGAPDAALGERFIDMTEAYDADLVAIAERAAWKTGVAVRRGVYLGIAGPSYETPAEIRMARTLGADAVGMSTVLETIAARQRGMRVLGLSCLTNMAAGVTKRKLDHPSVLTAAAGAAAAVDDLVTAILPEIAEARS